ncbi:ribosome biogenesis GTPase [Bacillus oleivorans]|uniref:Small ribosomal subunit biogenesis GTPase RsgA n=1 Tax=Bacillus oleivorans TaxID=1448271 RepID=A0A285D1B2_9BACI|nr:ribosome small subunit-dependent GTPase A [Bacillus oleivorans]SNX73549.1 ribosome biogenesis GTPase [Bacillus oleivorans]
MPEGKIMKALSGFYYVASDDKIYQCRGRGVFRKNKVTPLVGDMVEFQAENELEGYILDVKERKNELVRPPISNVDQAIITFSCLEPSFNSVLLDRFLVLIESKQIHPVICITKIDLVDKSTQQELDQYAEDYRKIGYDWIVTSSKEKLGLDQLTPYLKEKTSVVAGQSGVGKSSLLNAINPKLELKTNDISAHLGRGKHTTRHVELLSIAEGFVADTPGFSSLEFDEIELDELSSCFPEFLSASESCKFRGCHHMNEPKCAVKLGVEQGDIPSYRYQHYLSFYQEIKDRKPRY